MTKKEKRKMNTTKVTANFATNTTSSRKLKQTNTCTLHLINKSLHCRNHSSLYPHDKLETHFAEVGTSSLILLMYRPLIKRRLASCGRI